MAVDDGGIGIEDSALAALLPHIVAVVVVLVGGIAGDDEQHRCRDSHRMRTAPHHEHRPEDEQRRADLHVVDMDVVGGCYEPETQGEQRRQEAQAAMPAHYYIWYGGCGVQDEHDYLSADALPRLPQWRLRRVAVGDVADSGEGVKEIALYEGSEVAHDEETDDEGQDHHGERGGSPQQRLPPRQAVEPQRCRVGRQPQQEDHRREGVLDEQCGSKGNAKGQERHGTTAIRTGDADGP